MTGGAELIDEQHPARVMLFPRRPGWLMLLTILGRCFLWPSLAQYPTKAREGYVMETKDGHLLFCEHVTPLAISQRRREQRGI